MKLRDSNVKNRKQLNNKINKIISLIFDKLYCFISDEDEFNICIKNNERDIPLLSLYYYKNKLICDYYNKDYKVLCNQVLLRINCICYVSNIRNYIDIS